MFVGFEHVAGVEGSEFEPSFYKAVNTCKVGVDWLVEILFVWALWGQCGDEIKQFRQVFFRWVLDVDRVFCSRDIRKVNSNLGSSAYFCFWLHAQL